MKKFTFAALIVLASVAFAQDTATVFIRNACDSLHSKIELVPAYVEEANWYGNPHTMAKDSSNFKRHDSYKSVKISAKRFPYRLPLSVSATCSVTSGTTFKYATWNNSKQWMEETEDDFATYIYDIHAMEMEGFDSTNTYNLLGMAPEKLPDNDIYNAGYMLASKTFEFAFEWWFVGFTHEFVFDTTIDGKTYQATGWSYSNSIGMDSLRVFEVAQENMDYSQPTRTIRSEYVHVQSVKVVLIDSRKPLLPESSSSVVVSSSSEEMSSSSEAPASSSSEGKSSSSVPPVSSSSEAKSSSSEILSSSSEAPGPESSADVESSSSEEVGPASSDDVESSSSENPETSSSEEPETSSSTEEESSSSEGPTRLVTLRSLGEPARIMQVRSLDGTIVKNTGRLAPGVYYVKNSEGKWSRMAVLPR